MHKHLIIVVLILYCTCTSAQQRPITKTLNVSDSISIDTLSISPVNFKVLSSSGQPIDDSLYNVSFKKSILYPKQKLIKNYKSIRVSYYPLPKFITQSYSLFDPKIIVQNNQNRNSYFDLIDKKEKKYTSPFQGLNTSGNISRAIVVGNNQNAVTQSELDLQISGNISPKVSLRASIQDANIPSQTNGFSQRLDEFDQIFIELQAPNWGIRAGDIDLVETESFFAAFTKRVQGLRVSTNLGQENKTNIDVAGALVRGVFARTEFTAQEGNQGPYKIRGPNGELFVLIVSGSEAVFINGKRLQRGENYDYTINYNAGELVFNATFPITSEMRVVIEYQYTEQNFTRFVANAKTSYKTEKWGIHGMYFTETDLKNQPLQQSLNEAQVQALSQAGDDKSQMFVPSENETDFSENRILYKKETIEGIEAFVFSNNPEDTLFNVTFTEVGENEGNYILDNVNTITNIYLFVPPINGISQGNYAPIRQLIAPQRLQVATVNGYYNLSNKTEVNYELTFSQKDENLFSDNDDDDNNGVAAKLSLQQNLIKNSDSLTVDVGVDFNYVDRSFNPIQRLFNVEFTRDWNIENIRGNQVFTDLFTNLNWKEKISTNYRFQQLDFSDNFYANKHVVQSSVNWDPLQISLQTSILNSTSNEFKTTFMRLRLLSLYSLNKYWIGAEIDLEDLIEKNKITDSLTIDSQRFIDYKTYLGVGDSTAVFAQLGYRHRKTDSLFQGSLSSVSTSNDINIRSRLLKKANTQLQVFINYRDINFQKQNTQNRDIINARLQYKVLLLNKKLNLRTTYETNSGSVARQGFSFVQVEPGQGQYVWIDYNENGIQELNEFEIAQFQDQAEYVRILLPNQVFIGVNQNRFSEQLTLNFRDWQNKKGVKGFVSKLFNQSSFNIDKKIIRDGNAFRINPFSASSEDDLALISNFRNTIFYNRGLQKYTNSYTFLSNTNKNILSNGLQQNKLLSHQWDFIHKIKQSWVINTNLSYVENESNSENFTNRNYKIISCEAGLKTTYLFSTQKKLDLFYDYKTQQNDTGNEALTQHTLGVSFALINSNKYNINGEFTYINNDFEGNSISPVAFQMLEGLQPDDNFTWTLFLQKKITDFLDININYSGRKSPASNTIHTGTIQLRAYF